MPAATALPTPAVVCDMPTVVDLGRFSPADVVRVACVASPVSGWAWLLAAVFAAALAATM